VDDYEFKQYRLDEIETFAASLEAADELAVETTGNSRWLVGVVERRISRVVVVNPSEFEVIKRSVKKTDKRDALNLARFLAVDMLPAVRQRSELAEAVARMNETRNKMVGLKTSLLNKIHGLAVSRGWKLRRESLSSKKGLTKVTEFEWTAIERIELEIIIEQIGSLKESIKRLDEAIAEISPQMAGFENLITVTGIGTRSAAVLISVIGEVADFATESKLASYFGIVPRVSNSNEQVHHGRITKRGSKMGRTTLVQCALVAIRYNPYLKKYYEQVKARRGHGKAKIAVARKYLGIIYNTLKNNWMFEDFNNFVLQSENFAFGVDIHHRREIMAEPREPKKMIEPNNWENFLAEFTKRNRDRRARFNLFYTTGETQEEAEEAHLESVSLNKDGGQTQVVVTRIDRSEEEEKTMTDTLENVRGIAVQYETDGSENFLEITDTKNTLISLRFESKLDGAS